jgi:outer membrane protein OmpA-like peptidoglycan-associated protein
MRLSQARAESVQTFLIQNGVSTDRLQARGYGPDNPIDSNNTRDGRARNRRVELTRLN